MFEEKLGREFKTFEEVQTICVMWKLQSTMAREPTQAKVI